MKTKILSALAAFSSVFFLSSCSEKPQDGQIENPVINFETYNVGATYCLLNTAELFGQEHDITYSDSLSVVLPTRIYDNDISALRERILSEVLGINNVTDIRSATKKSFENTVSQLGYQYRRVPAQNENPRGFSYTSGFVVYLNSDIIVYCVSNDSFMPGAAHGMPSKLYINYWISSGKTGKILSLKDLFTSKGLKELPDMIAERAQTMSDLIGPTSVEGLPENDNFFISSEGQIVFVYQPLEIASYAQGFINVTFDPYELLGQMTPYAIELFGLSDLEEY